MWTSQQFRHCCLSVLSCAVHASRPVRSIAPQGDSPSHRSRYSTCFSRPSSSCSRRARCDSHYSAHPCTRSHSFRGTRRSARQRRGSRRTGHARAGPRPLHADSPGSSGREVRAASASASASASATAAPAASARAVDVRPAGGLHAARAAGTLAWTLHGAHRGSRRTPRRTRCAAPARPRLVRSAAGEGRRGPLAGNDSREARRRGNEPSKTEPLDVSAVLLNGQRQVPTLPAWPSTLTRGTRAKSGVIGRGGW